MSAVPSHFMNENREPREPEAREDPQSSGNEPESDSQATFWHWFALAVLLFAWIAEATMCADRGF